MVKWYVTVLDQKTMKNKTVLVSANSKTEAIEKGCKKVGSNRLIECKMKRG